MTKTTPVRPFPPDSADRRFLALRYWLHGQGMTEVLRNMEFNRRHFSGTRKDGLTPAFDHHVVQANFIRPLLPHLLYPQETLCVIFSHDTAEDRGLSPGEITKDFSDREFGRRVADAVWLMTKKFRGGHGAASTPQELFRGMAENPIASIAKGVDRIHNLQSMVGVFTREKQASYLAETEEFFLPMLKEAERLFPEQEPAYKLVRTVLKMQIELLRAGLPAAPSENDTQANA